MSALPPKADMCGAVPHVCFGPIADITPFCISVGFRDGASDNDLRYYVGLLDISIR
jgi:hypothetical protein